MVFQRVLPVVVIAATFSHKNMIINMFICNATGKINLETTKRGKTFVQSFNPSFFIF